MTYKCVLSLQFSMYSITKDSCVIFEDCSLFHKKIRAHNLVTVKPLLSGHPLLDSQLSKFQNLYSQYNTLFFLPLFSGQQECKV